MRPKHHKERFQQSNSHTNLVNLVQNINKSYKNVSHNMGSKMPQPISPNHIKIKGIKIIGLKTRKHQEHSILSTNSHQGINWSIKHNNHMIIIIKPELQYNKHPKIHPNLIL